MALGRQKLEYDREYLITQIAMMRIKGKSTQTILEFLQGKLGMGIKIAYEHLRDAQKYILQHVNHDLEVAFAESINRLEILFEEGDNKLKLEVQKELNKLRGLYAAQKIDLNVEYKAKFPGLDE